jgi:hypothetical protein
MNMSLGNATCKKVNEIPPYIFLSHEYIKDLPYDPCLFMFGKDFSIDPQVAPDLRDSAIGDYIEYQGQLVKYFEPIQKDELRPDYVIRSKELIAYLEDLLNQYSLAQNYREPNASKYISIQSLSEFFARWAQDYADPSTFATLYENATGFSQWYDSLLDTIIDSGDVETLAKHAPHSSTTEEDLKDIFSVRIKSAKREELEDSICCTAEEEKASETVSGSGHEHLSVSEYTRRISKYLGKRW